MKHLVNFSVIALLLTATMNVMATELTTASYENSITVTDKKEKEKKEDATNGVEPLFVKRGEIVYVIYDNTTDTPLSIEVRDGMDRIVYSESIKEDADILKLFNFKKAFKGSYTIKVDNGSKTFHEVVEIL